jgi:small subunit ribosomal protein S4
MKRKRKTYSKPKRPFDKTRIDEEAQIKKEFGLKNKREIWKAEAKVNLMRKRAKDLILAGPQEQQIFFNKLKKIGIKVDSIADVLSLDKKDYLNRRLQTVLVTKKMATTSKSARQLITHKKVMLNGRVLNSPSYIVPVELENKISLKESKMKKKENKPKEEEKNE